MGRGVLHTILRTILAISVAAAAGATATSALAANVLQKSFWMSGPNYDGRVPLCSEHGPLDKIVSRFSSKENRFWNSDLEIIGFEKIREVAWEPWSSNTIPRRFCTASVRVSDGKWHQINYSIIEDAGMFGSGYGVEWCVVGLDRNWAYNPSCKFARP
jgi:hypothetical protein